MNAIRRLLTTALLACSALCPVLAAPDNLPQLRADYLEAKDFLKATPKPLPAEEGFAVKLEMWSEISRRHRDAAKALLIPLVATAVESPADRFPALRDELLGLHRDLVDGPTQASHDNLAFFSRVALPHLRDRTLPEDRAALLVRLTTPDQWVRGYDQRILMGLPSEPTGLLIQDVHSLALARAGEFTNARKESDLLLKKARTLLGGRLPDLEINHGGQKRTKASLLREFLLHRALVESLAGESAAAQGYLEQADKIEEPNATILRDEAALRTQLAR